MNLGEDNVPTGILSSSDTDPNSDESINEKLIGCLSVLGKSAEGDKRVSWKNVHQNQSHTRTNNSWSRLHISVWSNREIERSKRQEGVLRI